MTVEIHVRNKKPGESDEEYQQYLDDLFRPMGEAVKRIRDAAARATGDAPAGAS